MIVGLRGNGQDPEHFIPFIPTLGGKRTRNSPPFVKEEELRPIRRLHGLTVQTALLFQKRVTKYVPLVFFLLITTPSPAAVGFVSEDEYLEIQGITREQSGDYECSASNDVAAPVVRRVKVTVNYPPYISEAKGTGVPVGQKGTLQCEASAVPSAEFQWYKDDKRLIEGKKGVKVENRPFLSKLIFFNVSEHDYGNYTCVASNKLGHTNASITLFGKTEP
ncbi:hypothetical protein HPG69_019414 [Diceros bicornis minor]|uniref:Ig-like domain-containing protein n=1 Tax=Diceros bicornis minor TaxID=77932 RepID=A0A7J7F0Q0_DICBM|nr:hypothetical protein HPG69_019414 [Diceros bicornis minor]